MKGLIRSLGRAPAVDAPIRRQRVPVVNAALTVVNGSSAPGKGSVVLGGLPEGNILYLGAVAYLQFSAVGDTDATATWGGSAAIGTLVNADADLADAGDADLLPATAIGPAVARVTSMTRFASTDALGGGIIDNTDHTLALNLNVLINDADQSGDISVIVNGYVDLVYIVLNDD